MLFGGLFAGYIILRVGSTDWPAGSEFGLSVPIAFFNTVVLITSSVTMVMAWASLVRKNNSRQVQDVHGADHTPAAWSSWW